MQKTLPDASARPGRRVPVACITSCFERMRATNTALIALRRVRLAQEKERSRYGL